MLGCETDCLRDWQRVPSQPDAMAVASPSKMLWLTFRDLSESKQTFSLGLRTESRNCKEALICVSFGLDLRYCTNTRAAT